MIIKETIEANILKEFCDENLYIAFLQLQEVPDKAIVVRLSKNIHAGHSFKSFGFRKSGEFEGSFTPKGEIVADDVIVRELVKTEEFRLGSNLRFYESELDNDSISIRGEIWKPLSEELSS